MYWETNRFPPKVMFYPAIISFLGYFPFNIDSATFGGKIKRYRFEKGLSLKVFAQLAGVDPASVGLWEEGRGKPGHEKRAKVLAVIDQ